VAEGAPSLRFLQGWVAMLPALFDLLWRRDQTHLVSDSRPSQSARRTGHPPCGDAGEIRSLGRPATRVSYCIVTQILEGRCVTEFCT
jgi:hypothetical protein